MGPARPQASVFTGATRPRTPGFFLGLPGPYPGVYRRGLPGPGPRVLFARAKSTQKHAKTKVLEPFV